ncbi:MAG: OmpW family protein [Aquabacterium sp.]|uniref:OmpW family protein n=1 Tax=Aquabacterium sp. TaxID=1872578 RepID=UPI0035C76C22
MSTIFNRSSLIAAAALACAALTPAVSQAAAGDIVVRARALYLEPANESDAIPSLEVPENAIKVSSKYIWEIDASYFVTDNVALELIATSPQKHTVSIGDTKLGTVRHLPPTLTVQYHFAPTNPVVRPYIGAGLNYTRFSAVKLAVPEVAELELEKNSWGPAFQIGADFPITDRLSLNVDFKKIDIRSDVKIKGTDTVVTRVKIDPILFGIGLAYRF